MGQDHLAGPEGVITRMLAAGRIPSIILWGPPGTGKTTIARLLAGETGLAFEQISAIFSGVADLKKVFEQARIRREQGRGTLLFVDEIHRFNKSQQDLFLPYVEDGTIILVGATTENPSFELNGALLSRAQVLVLNRLDTDAMQALIRRAEMFEKRSLPAEPAAREAMIGMADGDGRYFLNMLEEVFAAVPEGGAPLDTETLARTVQKRMPLYDKAADGHYNLISALHKSVRGSDPDAALYYLARMLVAGEDPLFIVRRVVRMAVEDVGLADPEPCTRRWPRRRPMTSSAAPKGIGHRAGGGLCGECSEVQRALHRLQGRDGAGEANGLADAAQDHPQRADQADEATGIRHRLPLRPRPAGCVLGPELLPGRHGAGEILRPRRTRLRTRGAPAAGVLVEVAERAGLVGSQLSPIAVIPAKAGSSFLLAGKARIPGFAGMTDKGLRSCETC